MESIRQGHFAARDPDNPLTEGNSFVPQHQEGLAVIGAGTGALPPRIPQPAEDLPLQAATRYNPASPQIVRAVAYTPQAMTAPFPIASPIYSRRAAPRNGSLLDTPSWPIGLRLPSSAASGCQPSLAARSKSVDRPATHLVGVGKAICVAGHDHRRQMDRGQISGMTCTERLPVPAPEL